ncbi:MAG: aminotransferase class I/II-fold pyridoxal phosphate-dependent enzyme [Mycobacterium sp.]|nr:aminotransferase class I/II-fold pyridoxal phosphate-dependent enzyme [Mycobacterium sp.]
MSHAANGSVRRRADVVDLRSDTVSAPTERMRRAMANAEVGDDWFGDDPTVNRLQERVAELTGKQASMYLASGTLCNQIAMHAFVRSGHFVLCEASAHTCGMEVHSSAALSGIAFRRVPARSHGILAADQVADALQPDPYDVSVVELVAIENTHQLGGGSVMPVRTLAEIANTCAARHVPVYLDGARIFNACAVAGVTLLDYATHADALMVSLSKGLGAPVGSVLAGDAEFIAEARRLKILFGGAWRQAGILAAAGLVALDEGPGRLVEDHQNARKLAAGIAEILPGSVDPAEVPTNVVFVDVADTGWEPREWADRLAAEGVLTTTVSGRVRMLTHRDVDAADVSAALTAWRRVAADWGAQLELRR